MEEEIVHGVGVLCHVAEQVAYGIAVVACDALDGAHAVLFHQQFAYLDDILLRQAFSVEGGVKRLSKLFSASHAAENLMACIIVAILHDFIMPAFSIKRAFFVRAMPLIFGPWSGQNYHRY